MTTMHKEFKAFRIYMQVGHSILKIHDISDERVFFDVINKCDDLDGTLMTDKLMSVISEHMDENRPYRTVTGPLGYGE
jgi:hypothetical protein